MTIIKVGLPDIMPDNDLQYLTYIIKVVQKMDANADITIIRGSRTYAYNITPSEPSMKSSLISELTLANQLLGVGIRFSRTINLSTAIHFELV